MQYDSQNASDSEFPSLPQHHNAAADCVAPGADTRIHEGGRLYDRVDPETHHAERWQQFEEGRRMDERRHSHRVVVWCSVAGVLAMGGMFVLGMWIGQRAARMEASPTLDPLAQVRINMDHHDNLMFYQTLTAVEGGEKAARVAEKTVKTEKTVRAQPEKSPEKFMKLPEKVAKGSEKSAKAPTPEKVAKGSEKSVKAAAAPAANPKITRALHATGPAKAGEYTMQLGAYQTLDEATALVASLQKQGFSPYVISAKVAGKGVWHRVRMGRFGDPNTAQEGKQVLSQAKITGLVLRAE